MQRRQRAAAATARRHATSPVVDSIGDTEGALSLIAWVGYVEDGTTEGYEAYDWVKPFEDQTGCKVNVKYARHLRRDVQPDDAAGRGSSTACPLRATPRTG